MSCYLNFNKIAINAKKRGEVLQIHTDHLGTPRAVSDKNAMILWRWEGDAFGDVTPSIEKIKMPLRMAGQYKDAESGLFYNYFRFYNPATGRYIENDPIGLDGGLNRWGYVGGSPLSFVDSFGLCNCKALQDFVNYERNNGTMKSIFGDYSPISHSKLVPLNEPCESIFGPVDMDWMLRLSYSSLFGSGEGAWLDYRVFKFYWNVGRSMPKDSPYKLEFNSIYYPSNEIAPFVSNQWINGSYSLETLFKPALDKCGVNSCEF